MLYLKTQLIEYNQVLPMEPTIEALYLVKIDAYHHPRLKRKLFLRSPNTEHHQML